MGRLRAYIQIKRISIMSYPYVGTDTIGVVSVRKGFRI